MFSPLDYFSKIFSMDSETSCSLPSCDPESNNEVTGFISMFLVPLVYREEKPDSLFTFGD